MKLHDVLDGVAFVTGLLGVGGLGGAIDCGTGWLASGALLLICVASALWARYEDGTLGKKNSPR